MPIVQPEAASVPARIVARLQALLADNTDAGALIYVDREDAFTREESPALLLELDKEDTEQLGGGRLPGSALEVSELEFSVIACVRGAAWRAQADRLRVQCHTLILADLELKSLVCSVRRVAAEWKSANTDQPFGYAAQTYRVKYTSRADRLDVTA